MSFSEKSCLVFEQATKAYHITDHIDATVHNPYEVKSIEFYLYLKNWIDAVQCPPWSVSRPGYFP